MRRTVVNTKRGTPVSVEVSGAGDVRIAYDCSDCGKGHSATFDADGAAKLIEALLPASSPGTTEGTP